jgi:acyl-CoA thioester hydrolase
MDSYQFSIEMSVRDYECDLQGVVNNGVYQNYLEHARHEFLKQAGVDFAEYTKRGIRLVVVRAELDYKYPLTSGDRFMVGINLERVGSLRLAFVQDILRLPDHKVSVKGRITGAALNERGRPMMPEELGNLLPPDSAQQ